MSLKEETRYLRKLTEICFKPTVWGHWGPSLEFFEQELQTSKRTDLLKTNVFKLNPCQGRRWRIHIVLPLLCSLCLWQANKTFSCFWLKSKHRLCEPNDFEFSLTNWPIVHANVHLSGLLIWDTSKNFENRRSGTKRSGMKVGLLRHNYEEHGV